jgi:class 3 adenylate cyclase
VTEQSVRTLVCSVLFLDIAGYSKQSVSDQVRLKQAFNAALGEALEQVEARERVIVDTGDGAAMTFLDPESALYVALAVLDKAGDLKLRMGINLGPVSLMQDLNGMQNVVGDGINVAQRIMSFAGPGQLLVSKSFYDVVSHLSHGYALLFHYEGARTDKHVREHDVYALAEAVREGRRVAEEQARRKRSSRAGRAEQAADGQATISDVGTHYLISGPTRPSVERAIDGLVKSGCELVSPISQVGAKWLASCARPRLGSVRVETLGLKRVVSGPSREVVEAKLRELLDMGARLVQEVELHGGLWTAVCESR